MQNVFVSVSFDDLKSRHLRFLEEAAKRGALHVSLWPDEVVTKFQGRPPKFPLAERQYVVESIRFVQEVRVSSTLATAHEFSWPELMANGLWVVEEAADHTDKRAFAKQHGLAYQVLGNQALAGFPEKPAAPSSPARKKVIVTGCYDWFHSGHVRFFEEVSQLGDLYVVVGHDANVRLLKGEGHPLFPQDERRYIAGSIRYVTQALISTGNGWLDAEPEILRIKPDLYAVNEDGDKPEKRNYCQQHGIQYAVLKRTPKQGLTGRNSTNLRGF